MIPPTIKRENNNKPREKKKEIDQPFIPSYISLCVFFKIFINKMPSKFRRAISTVKDQTSIFMINLNQNSYGEYVKLLVPILEATSHKKENPDERNIAQVIDMVVSSTKWASACVRELSSRISTTSDYVVALKSLILIHHALREGGPYFTHEARKFRSYRGRRCFLDLSDFFTSLSYSSSPWDYTAFVRTFARYLDARLESATQGKLQNLYFRERMVVNPVNNMSPSIALVHIEHWQLLLDHAFRMKPTGPACNNNVVLFALYMVVSETFDLYEDISTSLNLLIDKFSSLDTKSRIKTIKSCHVASKQFVELDLFYAHCIKIGVGSATEYPRVQMISKTMVKNFEEHILDININALESSSHSQPRLSLQAHVRCKSKELLSEPSWVRPTRPALDFFHNRKDKTTSNLTKWEDLLVMTASQISNSENGSLYSQNINISDDHNQLLPESYKNPFL